MKTKTLYRNGKDVIVTILYEIFDNNNTSLTEDNYWTPAKNSRHALEIYFKSKKISPKVITSGDDDVTYCASPFFVENEVRYRAGNRIWYKEML